MSVTRVMVICLIALVGVGGAHAAEGILSVMDFGAVGDGKADDTVAIQAAIDKAKTMPRGTTVLVPPGEYRVTETITVENVLLKGLDAGAWCSDRAPMPTIRVDHTEGPCIIAKDAASVHGLNFDYDHKGEQARKFGPTILLAGNGISVTNLRIHQPYEGIMADGKSNIGRLNIENIFMVSARKCGVYVTNTYDIPTLRNVEVWNPHDYSLSNCVGFKLGRNDEIRLDNCFAFKCKIGYLFFKDENGSSWGGMTGCSADFSVEGVVIEDADSLRINGGSQWAHSTALRVEGGSKLVVSGVDLKANGSAALIVRNCDSLTLTGCVLGKAGDSWPDVITARLEGGQSVLINGCTFDKNGPGLLICEKMDHFSITNNVFQPSPFEAITDNSPATASKIVKDNLTKKIEAKKSEK